MARSKTTLGSSKDWPSQMEPDTANVLSTDPVRNPDFWGWTHVFVPYCTGDVHTGQQMAPNPWGLHFSGLNNIDNILYWLQNTTGLTGAKETLVSGSSAGGMGTFHTIDRIANHLSWSKVIATPQAGWFFPNVSNYDDWTHGRPGIMNDTMYRLWNMYVNEDCARALGNDAFRCFSLDVAYKYIRTPMFIVENNFDSNEIFAQLGCPTSGPRVADYVGYFGERMRLSVTQIDGNRDGLFLPSCLEHTGNINTARGPSIGGMTYGKALSDWYNKRTPPGSWTFIDKCPGLSPCNPTCSL